MRRERVVGNLVGPTIDPFAVIHIQKVWRGVMARRRVAGLKYEVEHRDKMQLSKALREMELAVGRHKMRFDDSALFANKIQQMFKNWRNRRRFREGFDKAREV